MKKLLVGSVFANDSPDQQQWLDLQLRFLRATTEDFDHIAVVSEGLTNDVFLDSTWCFVPPDLTKRASNAHLNGLQLLLNLFGEKKDQYENFLFLDSDAFPIRQQWLPTLLLKMQSQDRFNNEGVALTTIKNKWRNYEIAVALRSENLETRLHASILFVKGEFLKFVDFKLDVMGNDLAGNPESDIFMPTYQFEKRTCVLPLIRTNQTNIHPLACGIYFDMFYHHACGSGRPFALRAADFYLQKIIKPKDDVSSFTKTLMAEPTRFVSGLAGWNPQRYAQL